MPLDKFSEIDLKYFTSDVCTGGHGGHVFLINNSISDFVKGIRIRALTFWCNGEFMKGCEIKLTNNETHMVGHKDGRSEEFYFEDDERLTSLKLWNSKKEGLPGGWGFPGLEGGIRIDRLFGVEWTTSANRNYSMRVNNVFGNPISTPDVGTGILVGVFGKAAADIDSFGFAMLRKIKNAELVNFTYPGLSTAHVLTKPSSTKTIQYDNSDGDLEQSFTFSGEMTTETSSTFSITSSFNLGIEYSISASIPLLADLSATVKMDIGQSTTRETTKKDIKTKSFSFPVKVPPRKKVLAIATLYTGKIDLPFEAKMIYHLETGHDVTVDIKGQYSGVDSDKVMVKLDQD